MAHGIWPVIVVGIFDAKCLGPPFEVNGGLLDIKNIQFMSAGFDGGRLSPAPQRGSSTTSQNAI